MTDWLRSRLLPVLDLKDGLVVRGVGGRRDEYQPIVSKWTVSSHPIVVTQALRNKYGLNRFYVADLDAIVNRTPHRDTIAALVEEGFELDVDAGVRSDRECAAILATLGVRAVLGLETMESPSALAEITRQFPVSRLVFSVDLKNGVSLGNDRWPASPMEIAAAAVSCGIRSLIVLDLAAVGEGNGCPTLELCSGIRSRWRDVELITGGGIRDVFDVERAIDSGADQVLVASALHDGRLL